MLTPDLFFFYDTKSGLGGPLHHIQNHTFHGTHKNYNNYFIIIFILSKQRHDYVPIINNN